MESIGSLLRPLDLARAKILRQTLKITLFRNAFSTRYYRSNVIVGLSILLNILLMVYFPLWTLLIAPSILGTAHLIESLGSFHPTACPRLADDGVAKRRANRALFLFCLSFLSFRIIFALSQLLAMGKIGIFLQDYSRLLDFSVVAVAFLYFSHHYQISLMKRLFGAMVLAIIGFFLVTSSGLFWGIFIFSHNFMAFAFWYHYAPTRREKLSSLVFLGIFGCIHIFVLMGIFDELFFSHALDQRPTEIYGYSIYNIASELFPKLFDLDQARKIVSLLCFGQGLHYILWIRVIPECRMNQKAPIPFRTRFKKREEDWGYLTAIILSLILLGFLLAGIFCRWNLINELFFGLAFFHIYAEYLAFAFQKLTHD